VSIACPIWSAVAMPPLWVEGEGRERRHGRRTPDYVPAGLPRGDGLEMSIMAIRSFSSYQQ
jgi:hypothetical protein